MQTLHCALIRESDSPAGTLLEFLRKPRDVRGVSVPRFRVPGLVLASSKFYRGSRTNARAIRHPRLEIGGDGLRRGYERLVFLLKASQVFFLWAAQVLANFFRSASDTLLRLSGGSARARSGLLGIAG
jgi:hypothetical protein